ncbi:MAG: hypothetical protein [Bacteriophage sp.]|nr:MAG: hypothetical protein [Bacteriophage sp.]
MNPRKFDKVFKFIGFSENPFERPDNPKQVLTGDAVIDTANFFASDFLYVREVDRFMATAWIHDKLISYPVYRLGNKNIGERYCVPDNRETFTDGELFGVLCAKKSYIAELAKKRKSPFEVFDDSDDVLMPRFSTLGAYADYTAKWFGDYLNFNIVNLTCCDEKTGDLILSYDNIGRSNADRFLAIIYDAIDMIFEEEVYNV